MNAVRAFRCFLLSPGMPERREKPFLLFSSSLPGMKIIEMIASGHFYHFKVTNSEMLNQEKKKKNITKGKQNKKKQNKNSKQRVSY